MKKDWKDIEGFKVRVDVGSTFAEAMSSSMGAAVICFTTDGHIVLNGISYITSTTEFVEIESGLASLTKRVDKNTEDINENATDISKLQQTSATLTDKVGTLEAQMEDAIDNVGNLLQSDAKHEASINDLTERVEANEGQISAHQDDIDALIAHDNKTDKKLAEHADLINSFYGNLDNLREDIDDNSNRIDGHDASIASLTKRVDKNTEDINTLETKTKKYIVLPFQFGAELGEPSFEGRSYSTTGEQKVYWSKTAKTFYVGLLKKYNVWTSTDGHPDSNDYFANLLFVDTEGEVFYIKTANGLEMLNQSLVTVLQSKLDDHEERIKVLEDGEGTGGDPCVLHLGDYDTEAEALDALAQPIICGNLSYGIIHATYAGASDVLCFQSIDGRDCRQIIWNKTRQFQRGIYFTDSSRSRISWKEDWQFLGLDRLSWSTSGHKYVPNLFGNGYNHDYCDPIPMASASADGLMSSAYAKQLDAIPTTYATQENLRTVSKMASEAQAGYINNSQTIAELDTRVTALEDGGTGGGTTDAALAKRVASLETQVAQLTALLKMA